MARSTNKLSARHLTKLEPGVYADGGGLYLQITRGTDGTPRRSWLCRVRVNRKPVDIGLGRAAYLSLADARAKAAELRKIAAQGINPIEQRKAEAAAKAAEEAERRAREITFKQAAQTYIADRETKWRNEKHRKQWTSSLEAYAYPVFGSLPVGAVDRAMVLKVIEPLWKTKLETASRLRGRIENVLDWATVRGLRSGENPARWRGALDKVLPSQSKALRQKHHPSMPYTAVGAFMRALATKKSAAADCLRFLILTAARYNEAAGARWSEIDLAAKVWTIPGERMKAGRTHRVALSTTAVAILEQRAKDHGSAPDRLVFESDTRRGAQLSDMTLSAILRRMKEPFTVHGFRSSFRVWAAEETSCPREVAEAALAHTNSDRVEAAYQRSDFFEKRRRLMQEWADYLGKLSLKVSTELADSL